MNSKTKNPIRALFVYKKGPLLSIISSFDAKKLQKHLDLILSVAKKYMKK